MAKQFTPIRLALLIAAITAAALAVLVLARRDHDAPKPAAAAADDRVLPTSVSDDGVQQVRFASRPYHLDRIYESMHGPSSEQHGLGREVTGMASDRGAGVVWVSAIQTRVVDAETLEPVEQEFFCHSNLELEANSAAAEAREQMFGAGREVMDSRLFTLIPGRLGIRLPEGFALPLMPGEELFYQSMVLNLNVAEIDRHVRLVTELEVVPPQHSGEVRPLYRRALYTLQEIDPAAPMSMTPEQAEQCGCGPGNSVSASTASVLPRFGGNNTLHWYVPPGEHEYVQDVTEQLSLGFDTKIHYATVHLHPTGKWAQLRDATTGETVLRLAAKDLVDRRGVVHVEELSTVEGVALQAGHRYELVTLYENPGEKPVDAMSILYLYLAGRDDGATRARASNQ